MDERVRNYKVIRKFLDNLSPYEEISSDEITISLVKSAQNLDFMENNCPYYMSGQGDKNAISFSELNTTISRLKTHIKFLEIESNKRKKLEEHEELKRKEQRMFDLELEKQRLAQEHEMERLDKLLQIEEMKLIREREQRQAEQDQIDSLKDSIRQS